jgi:hypothetical protein
MAKRILSPHNWNVEFQIEDAKGNKRSLFVDQNILSVRSEYYKTSTSFASSLSQLILVFASNFREGVAANADCGCTHRGCCSAQRTLTCIEPFEILYPVLYYLYTDRTLFTSDPAFVGKEPYKNIPYCNPEQAYAIADRFGLTELKQKAYNFLADSLDADTVVPRIFGELALTYDEIAELYESAFYLYWKTFRSTFDIWDYLEGVEDENQKMKVMDRYTHLMRGLVAEGGVRSK